MYAENRWGWSCRNSMGEIAWEDAIEVCRNSMGGGYGGGARLEEGKVCLQMHPEQPN